MRFDNDCVPLAIHYAAHVGYDEAIQAVKKHGWDEKSGIYGVSGWHAMRDLGINVSQIKFPKEYTTVARFLREMVEPHKRYILDVRGHWFAVHDGRPLDPAGTHPRSRVYGYMVIDCPKYCWCRPATV